MLDAFLHHQLLGALELFLLGTQALIDDADFRGLKFSARFKQRLLIVHVQPGQGVGTVLEQIRMEADLAGSSRLGLEPTLHGPHHKVLLTCRFKGRQGIGVVEHNQGFVFLDMLTFLDQNIADDATRHVLHRLALGVDHDAGR